MLAARGVPVFERLAVSAQCPLVLPSHAMIDRARERASGDRKIGTTGRGVGPAYEDKVARRAVRVGDLLRSAAFRVAPRASSSTTTISCWKSAYGEAPVDFRQTLDACLAQARAHPAARRRRHG